MKSSVLKILSIALLFFCFCFFIYANTFDSPFIFDDTERIRENPHIRLTQFSLKDITAAGFKSSRTRPVAFISFALNYYFHQHSYFSRFYPLFVFKNHANAPACWLPISTPGFNRIFRGPRLAGSPGSNPIGDLHCTTDEQPGGVVIYSFILVLC